MIDNYFVRNELESAQRQNQPTLENNQESPESTPEINQTEFGDSHEDTVGVEQPQVQAQPIQPKANDRNIRELRQRAERLERERNEFYQQLQERSQGAQKQPESTLGLNADDLAEGRHIQALEKKIRDQEEAFNAYKQQSAEITAETRLKSQYPDFYSVVTHESLETLSEQFPALAATIDANKDTFTKASAAYEILKKLNISPNAQSVGIANVDRNMQKPRPVASLNPQSGDSPLTKANAFANGLTPDLQKQLFKEMQESKRRA